VSLGFSIVTPTLNAATYLADCLDSVQTQGCPELEHLVVDGGSVDGTEAIARARADVRWVDLPRSNQSRAINYGLQRACHDIVAWLNADDTYVPGALAAVADCFADDPELDVLFGDCDGVDPQGRFLWHIRPGAYDFRRLLGTGNYLAQPASFFRRRVFERIGYVDETLEFGMDFELWLRLRECRVRYLPRTLATFRWHPQSKCATNQAGEWRDDLMIIRRYGGNWTPELGWAFIRCLMTMAKDAILQQVASARERVRYRQEDRVTPASPRG
jgi:glycosyltransferase involved in cell wall biosynthesis